MQLTLGGNGVANGINSATDGFGDDDLDGLAPVVEVGMGGQFQSSRLPRPFRGWKLRSDRCVPQRAVFNPVATVVATAWSYPNAIASIYLAITAAMRARCDFESIRNRLSENTNENAVMAENDRASDSSIKDADVDPKGVCPHGRPDFKQIRACYFRAMAPCRRCVLSLL